jgi:hypothetical protein
MAEGYYGNIAGLRVSPRLSRITSVAFSLTM